MLAYRRSHGSHASAHPRGRHGLLAGQGSPLGGRARCLLLPRRLVQDPRGASCPSRRPPSRRARLPGCAGGTRLPRAGRGRADGMLPQHPGERCLPRSAESRLRGGFLEMANARLYPFWGELSEALRTGKPQNELKRTGTSMFGELYRDPARLEQFMDAMSGISAGNFTAFAEKFDFSAYRTLCDVGGATGQLSCLVAERHPHLRCTTLDLPVVMPIAERRIAARGLGDRVRA